MKEKMEKAKEWIKQNKKRFTGIVAAVILIVGALVIGITGIQGFSSNASTKLDKTIAATDKESDNSEKDIIKKVDVDTQSEEEEDATQEDVATEKNVPAVENDSKGEKTSTEKSNSVKSSSTDKKTGSSDSTPTHTHNWQAQYTTQKKWVVDKAAWTETVNKPIYTPVEREICNGCGKDITGNATAHIKENMLAGNMACSAWHSEVKTVQTGTDTYTVNHPEQGHYKETQVLAGYRCSCGATK